MSWLKRRKKQPGWLALGLHTDRVDLVHVRRSISGRPELALCETFRKEGSDVDTLGRLRKELKLEQYRCTTLLSADQYQLHSIEAPPVPPAELKSAVRWRLKDVVDYPVDAATLDVLEIPGPGDGVPGGKAIYAITAKNEAIARCIRPFDAAQVPLEVVDICELAQRNIAALFEADGEGVAMLAFYPEDGMLTFTGRGELYVSRRIEIRLADLIAEDADERHEAHQRVAAAVERSLEHFEREFGYVQLGKLLVAPLPPQAGLQDYLASHIDGEVESADLAEVMDLSATPELKRPERQAEYLPMIGAALRSESARA